jgi:CarD family transcriptional regulator
MQLGDRVVHETHGAGVIARLEEREVLGQRGLYYLVTLYTGESLWVPVERAGQALRPPLSPRELEEVLRALEEDLPLPEVFMPRYREARRILREGSRLERAALLGTLHRRSRQKPLAPSEKEVLEALLALLASEVAASLGLGMEAARQRLLDRLEPALC